MMIGNLKITDYDLFRRSMGYIFLLSIKGKPKAAELELDWCSVSNTRSE